MYSCWILYFFLSLKNSFYKIQEKFHKSVSVSWDLIKKSEFIFFITFVVSFTLILTLLVCFSIVKKFRNNWAWEHMEK